MSNLKFCPSCNLTKKNTELKAAFAAAGAKFNKEDVIEFNKGFLWGISTNCGEEFDRCPFCNSEVKDCGISSEDFSILEYTTNFNRQVLEAMITLKEKDPIEYELKMGQFRLQYQQIKQTQGEKSGNNTPKCPTCGSTNIKKISSTAKVAGAVAFGLFSKTAKSQFKCNNCGNKW